MVNKNAEHTVNVYSARGWFGVLSKIEKITCVIQVIL